MKAMGIKEIYPDTKGKINKKGRKTVNIEKNSMQKKLREILLNKEKNKKDKNDRNFVKKMKTVISEHLGTMIDLDKRAYLLDNINNVLEELNNSKEDERLKKLLNISILRILPLAIYSPENVGHFGLASDCYSHFTSPIRRYADLVVHRIIKIINEIKNDVTNDEPKNEPEEFGLSNEEAFSISERCSEQSRSADKFEHMMNDVCTSMDIIFDDNYLKSIHSGIVSGLIPGGVFVDLGNGIEGFLPRRKITRNRVYLNEEGTELILEDSINSDKHVKRWRRNKNDKGKSRQIAKKIIFGIGDRVLVKIKKISIEKGQLEFRLS